MAKIQDDPFMDETANVDKAESNALLEKEIPKKADVSIDSETLKQILEANKALQKQVDTLTKKVDYVSDSNKVKSFEDSEKGGITTCAFTFSLYEKDGILHPVTGWKMTKNRVYDDGKRVDQIVEITFLGENGKTDKVEVPLIDMKFLKRTERIPALRMLNSDGSNVHFSTEINKETGDKYHKIHPKSEFFDCTFDYNGSEITINSNFLNV